MKCFFCNSEDTQVIDTRLSEDKATVKRRRKCPNCDKRFNTFETIEVQMPSVIKSDGRREEYNENKIKQSFTKALNKRPVSLVLVDQAIDVIKQELLIMGEREVESRTIGELVMQELQKLDKVAYIRFASIYRSFQDITDFSEIIEEVLEQPLLPR
jgi:transcriptional repressor NrdR